MSGPAFHEMDHMMGAHSIPTPAPAGMPSREAIGYHLTRGGWWMMRNEEAGAMRLLRLRVSPSTGHIEYGNEAGDWWGSWMHLPGNVYEPVRIVGADSETAHLQDRLDMARSVAQKRGERAHRLKVELSDMMERHALEISKAASAALTAQAEADRLRKALTDVVEGWDRLDTHGRDQAIDQMRAVLSAQA